MAISARLTIGVVVVRERIDHPWQKFQWRPIEVHANPPPGLNWRELRRTSDSVHYHAGTSEMVLHGNEVPGYLDNLANGAPVVYVILREADDDDPPIELHLVTPSPSEVQAYGEDGSEIIASVPMQPEIFDFVAGFVAENYKEEEFVKRKRKRFDKPEEYTFGQEPIVELRERLRKAGHGESDDPIR